MSKNLFRKGLATGAAIALAAIGFTATPASAANELTVVPTLGTSYNTFVDQNFTLTTSLANGSTLAHYDQYKYKIEVTGGTNSVDVNACAFTTNDSSWNYTNDGSNYAADTQLIDMCNADNPYVYLGYWSGSDHYADVMNSNSYDTVNAGDSLVLSANAWDTSRNLLTFQTNADTAEDTTTTVKVTTFVDADNSNTLNNSEWNTVRTINFKKYSEVKPSYSFVQPKAGDTSVKVNADFGDFNTEQAYYWNDFRTDFTGYNCNDWYYPADDAVAGGKMSFSDNLCDGLDPETETPTAKLYYWSWANNGYVRIAETTATITPHSITYLGYKNINVTESNDATNKNDYLQVRQNKTFTVNQPVYDVQATPAPKAGVAVTAHVYLQDDSEWYGQNYSLSNTQYVTVNGKKFTSESDLEAEEFKLTTDASGNASLTITPYGFTIAASDNVFYVLYAAENFTHGNNVWMERTKWIIHTTDKNDPLETGVRKSKFGVSNTVNYSVKDQFGLAGTGMRFLTQTRYCNDGCWYWTDNSYVNVTNGAASATFSSPAGSDQWEYGEVLLQEQNSDGNWTNAWWGDDCEGNCLIGYTMDFNTDTTAANFEDERDDDECDMWGSVTDDATYTAGGHQASYCEYATDQAGSLITLSAPGLGIELNGKMYLETVTFYTGYSYYDAEVNFYSYYVANSTVGYRVVTATANGTDDTLKLDFGFNPGHAASMVVSAPAQAQAGQALDIPVSVYDAHGNLTTDFWSNRAEWNNFIEVTHSGVGYLLDYDWYDGSFFEKVRDANGDIVDGKFHSKLVLGNSDIGASYYTAKIYTDYAFAGVDKNDNKSINVPVTIESGVTDADARASGKRVYVSYEFAQGRTLTVTIDGKRKYSKLITTDNAGQLSFYQKKKGVHTVTVRVSGGLVFTEHLTTK